MVLSVEDAVMLARDGKLSDALRIFDEDLLFTLSPVAMSYYALCLAAMEGNYDKAISLCLTAAEKEFYNPEIYHNLGKIFLLNGQKTLAIKAFRKGLKFDGGNHTLIDEVRRLGLRRKPIISFLARGNFVNRLLGRIAATIS
mgnify:CR=1 FL=1